MEITVEIGSLGAMLRQYSAEPGCPALLATCGFLLRRRNFPLINFIETGARGRLKDDCCLLDESIIKAPLGGDFTGKSPVHRGRLGAKRSLLTDSNGMPRAILSSKDFLTLICHLQFTFKFHIVKPGPVLFLLQFLEVRDDISYLKKLNG